MKNIDNLFSEFIDNLSLTDAQRKDAKTKYTGVIDCLAKHFYDRDSKQQRPVSVRLLQDKNKHPTY